MKIYISTESHACNDHALLEPGRTDMSTIARKFAVLLPLSLAGIFVAAPMSPARGQDISFRRDVVKLEPGEAPSPVYVIVAVVPPSSDSAATLTITDAGGDGPSELTVGFESVGRLPSPADTSYWRVQVSVSGIEAESHLSRMASVSLDGGQTGSLLDYTLDNVAGSSWELVPPPPDLVLGATPEARRTSLTVKSGNTPLTGLRIVQSTLQDEATRRLLGTDDVELVGESIRIDSRTSAEVRIGVNAAFRTPGTFKGSVMLGTDQSTETKPINLTVYNSPLRRRIAGTVFILAGVLISFFVGVYAKNEAFRLEALNVVSALLEQLAPLDELLAEAQEKCPDADMSQLRTRSTRLGRELDEEYLQKHGLLPYWFSNPASEQRATQLTAHLKEMAGILTILDDIVGRGVAEVLRRGDPNQPTFKTALEGLNAAADKSSLEEVREEVSRVLKGLSSKVRGGFTVPPERGRRSLTGSLQLLHVAVWLIWGTITTVGGFAAVVLANKGFGTGMDLVIAFFWGLGLPMTGQSLQQLTPSKIATHFNLSIPSGE